MSLTDIELRALKAPAKGQKLYMDNILPGFGCRVSQGGTKTFILVRGKDRQKITIGRYPILSLAKAREEAKRLLAEFTLGRIRPQSITYQQAVDLFIADKQQATRPGTVRQYKRLLGHLNFKCQLSEISHAEAARRINRFKAPSERSHALVAGKVFFNWCIKRRYITDNPLVGLSKPPTGTRDRILTDDELKAIWLATEDPTAFNGIVRFCIATGQRRGEVSQLKAEFFTDDTCTIPRHISKNGREHTFPLNKLAQVAADTFRFERFNNWSNEKVRLDKASGITGWTLHDLRRTFTTRLAEMSVAPHVIERLLNHITGQISGVSAIYNRATYMAEMRDAVDKWDHRLTAIITQP